MTGAGVADEVPLGGATIFCNPIENGVREGFGVNARANPVASVPVNPDGGGLLAKMFKNAF
jgi:hypothetical protein